MQWRTGSEDAGMARPSPPPAESVALDATNLHVRIAGHVALAGVRIEIPAGHCVAVVGESGAGKTTLLRCFNRMVVPSEGEVRVGGIDVARQDAAELRRRIGYVPQHGGLLPHWTVTDNAALVPHLLRR